MKLSKTLAGKTVIAIIFAGWALSLAPVFYLGWRHALQNDPRLKNEPPPITSELNISPAGLPLRLTIPAIKVDSQIESLALAPDGAMDTPEGPKNVAWFNLGTRPGDNGSAVLAGHYGTWKNGQGSVFDDLHKLRPGDKIYIEDDKGVTNVFGVREIRSYDPDADASDIFGSNDEKAHLNLITCEGSWNKNSESYSSRLVIFSDMEAERW